MECRRFCTILLATTWQVAALPDIAGPVVTDGSWRFTAVTERLIRVEYDEQHVFVDEPTVAFLRSKPIGVWQHTADHAPWSELSTSKVTVRYQKGQPPSATTLMMVSQPTKYTWTWGDDPEVGNLRGTARTLDDGAESLDLNCHHKVSPTMNNSEQHCTWGLISRKGWALVNDTGSPMWKNDWYSPSRNTIDVSVFMHGLDFEGAMQDFVYAAGKVALPPRFALGTMFTRWFNFDSDFVMDFINDFESMSMPLDAWIFDMNWHLYGPWGAFTWNTNSYPKLQEMLDWMQSRKLPIGANFHEHSGISSEEDTYRKVCEALGRNCSGERLDFDLYNKTYAMAQEDIAIANIYTQGSKQGIDFSWIDYQQGEYGKFQNISIPNLNPTIVLNALRSSFAKRHGEKTRSLIVSRWGGLGNHRYPVGFSGDQKHDWAGLAYLPYFTSTAANVAFNYWSHDTVGGDGEDATDYELSVRWVQTSAWSPVLRFHDKGAGTGNCAATNTCARVVPWDLPSAFFKAVRLASQERDQLLPYIYTAAFDGVSSGSALARPMYYENPADDALYSLPQQYLFGPDMVISPITKASGPEAKSWEQALGAVEWFVYAPKSPVGWFDRLNGEFVNGSNVVGVYGIKDVPGLVRQGAVIPMRPPRERGESSFARARQTLGSLEFRFTPAEAFYHGGSMNGSGRVIDDDGMTTDYLRNKFTSTVCEYSFKARRFTIRFSQSGDFPQRPEKVKLRLSFPQMPPLRLVSTSNMVGNLGPVSYDHHILGGVFTFLDVDLRMNPVVELEIDQTFPAEVLPNFIGALGRIRRARYIKDGCDQLNVNYGTNRDKLTAYVLSATSMSPKFAAAWPALWRDAQKQVHQLLASDDNVKKDHRLSKFMTAMIQDPSDSAAADAGETNLEFVV